MCAQWTENAKIVLESRYLAKDKKGVITETPDELLERVAKNISLAEKDKHQKEWEDKFLEIMDSLEFLPNSPALINAGRELQQLSACFCLPVEDNISHIFEMVKQSAIIHKTGGGCFAKGTLVMTNSGAKKIEDIIYNDPVLCYNLIEKKFEWGEVVKTFEINVNARRKVEIEFEDGSKIVCTEDHPFRIKSKNKERWVKAIDLTNDMEIIFCNETY